MSVVNVKVANIRLIGFDNLQQWNADPQNVYIARRGVVFVNGVRYPPQDSKWANPFPVKKHGRDKAIELYKEYIVQKLNGEWGWDALEELRGRRLGCWCCPEPCHGDFLVELLENPEKYKMNRVPTSGVDGNS